MLAGQEATYPLALNSLPFLAFLAAAAAVYFVTPRRFRWLVVLAASSYFYITWASWWALVGMFALIVVTHVLAVAIARHPSRRRLLVTLGVVASIGTLALLKYVDFFIAEAHGLLAAAGVVSPDVAPPQLGWVLPVGFSFITFTLASYVIDVHRGKQTPTNLVSLAAFVTYFPKILAGPIERATHFLPQWREGRRFDAAQAGFGAQLILWGLFKKVVIADRLAPFVNTAFDAPAFTTPVQLIVGSYFYAFQIYCDFSGYTDIAIGALMVFGIVLAPNFHHPYLSRSVPEFWSSRWHISLGTWFRDYLYIPLGGSRVSTLRTYLNLMIVFVVSGIWHAGMVGTSVSWTFAVWGAINGLYVVLWTAAAGPWRRLTKAFPRLDRLVASPAVAVVQVLVTFHLVTFSWIFFRADTLSGAWTVIRRIVENLGNLPVLVRFYDYQNFDFVASIVLIVLLIVVELWSDRGSLVQRVSTAPVVLRWGYSYTMIIALVILGEWGTPVFIYMQF